MDDRPLVARTSGPSAPSTGTGDPSSVFTCVAIHGVFCYIVQNILQYVDSAGWTLSRPVRRMDVRSCTFIFCDLRSRQEGDKCAFNRFVSSVRTICELLLAESEPITATGRLKASTRRPRTTSTETWSREPELVPLLCSFRRASTVPVNVLLLVQLRHWSLPAAVEVVSPLFPPVHLGQVLVKHLSGAQSRHQVVELATLLLLLCLPRPLLPLFLQLQTGRGRGGFTRERHRYL